MADPSRAADLLSRSVSRAIPVFAGSTERAEQAKFGLERAKLDDQIRRNNADEELKKRQLAISDFKLKGLQEEERQDNLPYSVRGEIDALTENLGPRGTAGFAEFAASHVVQDIPSAFQGDVRIEATGNDVNFYRLVNGEKQYISRKERRDPQVNAAITGIIASKTSKRKYLQTRADAGNPRAKELLAKYDADPVTGLRLELEGKKNLRNQLLSMRIQPDALKVIDKEIAEVEKNLSAEITHKRALAKETRQGLEKVKATEIKAGKKPTRNAVDKATVAGAEEVIKKYQSTPIEERTDEDKFDAADARRIIEKIEKKEKEEAAPPKEAGEAVTPTGKTLVSRKRNKTTGQVVNVFSDGSIAYEGTNIRAPLPIR